MTGTNSAQLLRCSAVTGEGDAQTTVSSKSFKQEDGKKSSFLLEESLTIHQPAHLAVDYLTSSSENPCIFFLGGFQLVANAKQVEIYMTDQHGKELYLMTSKGMQSQKGENGEEWQKVVCVVPGGPRPILKLKIKLLSLKPDGISDAQVLSLKITARLPEATAAAAAIPNTAPMAETSNVPITARRIVRTEGGPSSEAPNSPPTSGGITHADLGAAMASMSILARTTESGIESSLTEKFQHMDRIMHHRFAVLEHHIVALTSAMSTQQAALEQQATMLETQQRLIKTQSEQIQTLMDHQSLASEVLRKVQDGIWSLQESKDRPLRARTTPQLTIPPASKEEEPTERGIEQTLSNLGLNNCGDDDIGEDENQTFVLTRPVTLDVESAKTYPVGALDGGASLPDHIERIEVSLSGINQDILLGHIHEEGVGLQPSLPRSPLNDALRNDLPEPTRSFEDRNDKSEAKKETETDTSDNVQLEVLAVDEDKTVEVLESMTADEHERSPPDIADASLFEL